MDNLRRKIWIYKNSDALLRSLHVFLLFLLIIVFPVACEKEIDWDLRDKQENPVVVNARITNEFKIQKIQLSHPVKKMNDLPASFSGAHVNISWGQLTVGFQESDTVPGTYYSDFPFAAAVDREYLLTIEKGNLSFQAKTYMVPVLPFNLPVFSPAQDNGLFSINWNNTQYNPFEQAIYLAEISWSHLISHDHPDSLSRVLLKFYTLNTIDVSHIIFPQDREEVFFPSGSIVYFSKYSLNKEYGSYIRALLSESQWQGSLFESARGNLPGNISNGGLGYFSACAVLRDTLVVN